MKKSFLLTIVFVFASLMISGAPSIKVTNPSGGSFEPGQKCKIVWSTSGRMNQNVKIRLFDCKSNQKIIGISDKTPNDRSFPWVFPVNLADGNYYIKIRTVDNKVTGTSKCFIVKKKKSPTNPSPNNRFNPKIPEPVEMHNLKNPVMQTLDPKYKPKKNIFTPNTTKPWGRITSSKKRVSFGGYVFLKIEMKNAIYARVINMDNKSEVYSWTGTVPSTQIHKKEVSVSGVDVQFQLIVGSKYEKPHYSTCSVTTNPRVNYFQKLGEISNSLEFGYSFSGCTVALLKSRPNNKPLGWVTEATLTGNPALNNGIYNVRGEVRVKNFRRFGAKQKWKLFLLGKYGHVGSIELEH